MFTVINGKKEETLEKIKKEKLKKQNIYFKAFARKIVSEKYENTLLAIVYGIKYVNIYELNTNLEYLDFKRLFDTICLIKSLMKSVYIKDLINYFPIIKEYDGKRYECKDYFSTMDYLKTIDINDYMEDNLDDFLWNYYNHDLMNFSIKELLVLDRLRKLDGQDGLMEGFADMMGVDTYTINKEEGYIYNRRTGKTSPIKKSIPRGFKIIK